MARWRVRGRRVAAGLVLLAAAGCRSGPVAVAAPPLVGWTDAVPAALADRPVPAAPPCRAAVLRPVGAGFDFEPTAAGGTGTATFRNASRAPCRLEGRPEVRFVGATASPAGPGRPRGAPAQREQALPTVPPEFPAVRPPAATLRALPPGGVATLSVDWRNWCAAGPAPRAVRVTLPRGAGSLDVGYNAVTTCTDPGGPTVVGVRPFAPAALAAPGGWTEVRVQAAVRALPGRQLPPHGRPGELVRYAVELRNPDSAPLGFARCPAVAELLAPAGTTEVHALNCAAATPIPPGGAVLFEMRVRVPAAAPAGPNGLFWALDVTGSRPLEVVSRIVVDR
jgi:Protein of unknown function (DUF4232)